MASEFNLAHFVAFEKKRDLGYAHLCDLIEVVNPNYSGIELVEDYPRQGMTYLDMANFKWLLKRRAAWGYWTVSASDMDEAIDWACSESFDEDP